MMKIVNVLSITAALLGAVDAATKVAVLEFGGSGSNNKKGGGNAVRRTNSVQKESTVDGVASFWSALHHTPARRRLQHAGMPVVPDLFTTPDTGVVVGISGNAIDLDALPTIARLVTADADDATEDHVVGHMTIPGNRCDALMTHVNDVEANTDVAALAQSVKDQTTTKGLTGLWTVVDNGNTEQVDAQVHAMLIELDELARSTNRIIVVHLVVEEEEAASRRRLASSATSAASSSSTSTSHRRLEDEAQDEEGEDNENNNNNNQNNNNNNANGNGNGNGGYDGYYGYGYYNEYGEWVTTYKTMFQIQYFNVVFWTSVALVVVLFYTIYLMIDMPLEADTLLFGESAKMIGEE